MNPIFIASIKETGELIRLERKKKKISQLALSFEIGINQSQVSKIENGALDCSARQWIIIATHLGIPKTILTSEKAFHKRMMELKNG